MDKQMRAKTEYKKIRPPIVTVMGHVDHGKTSILDFIRKTNVQAKEYAGITQHIGAYQVTHKNSVITFIDTPGHEAFVQMRARGGKAADIVILVVAAEEGVKPQTKEAISHIKSAKTPLIVAINKIDLPGADLQKTKQQLASENILVEDWGGDIVCVPVSAKTGQGIENLLDAILAQAEIMEIKGSSESEKEAIIVESRLDRQKGYVVTCIVKNGILRIGDQIVAGGHEAKIKLLLDEKGSSVSEAYPSTPVEILGFKDMPKVGDLIVSKGSELAELSAMDDELTILGQKSKKAIGLVLKSDTAGTLEAIKASLAELVSKSVEATYALKFLHTGTGDINDSDVILAGGAKGIVLGFNARISGNVKDLADSQKVTVKSFQTIYDLIDYAKKILEGTAVEEEAKIKGRAQIVKLFKLESGDVIAGCKVIAGSLKPDMRIAIYDKDPAELKVEDEPLYRGSIKKLKRGQDDITVAGRDTECGVLLKPQFDAIQRDLWIEAI
ncbi:hypothetical protein A3K34_03485 [candidate division WWE3 bacterium RIFOXYC1_FULL_40_10]|nr:MAG: hypothetical protein A3K58_03485 [candidate division WWE3 bacterium RIFOXYB1_FULL_40_22]OGC66294.1 MAG: hypothetical protein A3K34_03485 [candidate division WWE3 bacterium RIFOXYC1_FULL_40_10]OGC67897.1 MAG: hypothetical protein A2450_01675 [candidate division WWE3 bacterium RIFOXYC2_FULL_40_11]OGC70561.1 MAG: hypothetical protein A2602_02670 [candidate division WWE3 bacterium RIFOXYD1_FULL_40_11]